MLLAAYQTQAGWLYVFGSAGLAVLPVLWGLAYWNGRGARLDAGAPEPLSVGAWVQLPVRVTRTSTRGEGPLLVLKPDRPWRWTDALFRDALVPEGWSYALLAAGAEVNAHVRFVASRRGVHPLPLLVLQSTDPLGLMVRCQRFEPGGTFVVYPRVWRVDRLPWLAGVLEAAGAAKRAREGPGEGVRGVREHRHGDSLRQIHWRTTARRGRLHVKESEQEVGDALCIWVDARVGDSGGVLLEHVLEVAATVVAYAQRTGLHFSLASQAGPLPPGHDPWEWLARLSPVSERSSVSAPEGALLISGLPPTDWQTWAGGLIHCPPASASNTPFATCTCPLGQDVSLCLSQGRA